MKSHSKHLKEHTTACRVMFKWLGNRKTLNAGQKAQAAQAFDADHTFLSASHKLMDSRHAAIKKLTAIKGEIQAFWKVNTLPYVEDGVRLLPKVKVESFVAQMEEFRDQLKNAVEELDLKLWEVKQEASNRLGSLYNPSDYPSTVVGEFQVSWEFPSTDPPDYLQQVAPQVYEDMKKAVVAKFSEAVQLAESAFMEEFQELITHLHEKLQPNPDGTKKTFKESTLTNLMEFFDKFKALNIGSNEALEGMIAEATILVSGATAKELRTSDQLRQEVSAGLDKISTALTPLVVNMPRRKIIKPKAEQPEKVAS